MHLRRSCSRARCTGCASRAAGPSVRRCTGRLGAGRAASRPQYLAISSSKPRPRLSRSLLRVAMMSCLDLMRTSSPGCRSERPVGVFVSVPLMKPHRRPPRNRRLGGSSRVPRPWKWLNSWTRRARTTAVGPTFPERMSAMYCPTSRTRERLRRGSQELGRLAGVTRLAIIGVLGARLLVKGGRADARCPVGGSDASSSSRRTGALGTRFSQSSFQ